MFAPVEFITVFAMQAIEQRADVLHFEPSWYFFDEYFPNAADPVALESAPLAGSGLPSHRERTSLRRLKSALLAKAGALPQAEAPPLPSGDLGRVFDRDQQVFMSNRAALPPLNYKQSDLHVLDGGSNGLATVSFFSDGRRYQRQPQGAPAFAPNVTASALALLGVELTGDFVSELAKVTTNATHAIVEFYFSWGGRITAPLALPLAVGGCTLSATEIAAGNFLRKSVLGAQGDPDELLLARRCPGDAAVAW